jgi:hypothetical protein
MIQFSMRVSIRKCHFSLIYVLVQRDLFRLKRPEKPKGEVVVRTKAERRKLHGHELSCCKPVSDASLVALY